MYLNYSIKVAQLADGTLVATVTAADGQRVIETSRDSGYEAARDALASIMPDHDLVA